MIHSLHRPNETPLAPDDHRLRRDERRIVGGLLIAVPLVLLALAPVMRTIFRMVLDLEREPLDWSWSGVTPVSLLPFFASLLLLGGWYVWLRWGSDRIAGVAFVAISLALGVQIGVAVAWNHPRVLKSVMRASSARTGPSFTSWTALNWLYQERLESGKRAEAKLAFIGSSQIMAAVNRRWLERKLDGVVVVRGMKGFSASQYLPAGERIVDAGATDLFCWISEIDMFRAEGLPVDRLRFLVDVPAVVDIGSTLDPGMAWKNRSRFADLFASAVVPPWRDRDLSRAIVLRAWFPATANETLPGHLGDYVRRTPMTEANFELFEAFAQRMRERNVRLHVFEGVSNFAPSRQLELYREETRERMRAMATAHRFEYVEASQMPQFLPEDFKDPLHLGPSGRRKFTAFVAEREAER